MKALVQTPVLKIKKSIRDRMTPLQRVVVLMVQKPHISWNAISGDTHDFVVKHSTYELNKTEVQFCRALSIDLLSRTSKTFSVRAKCQIMLDCVSHRVSLATSELFSGQKQSQTIGM
jgi:hypothetical protein